MTFFFFWPNIQTLLSKGKLSLIKFQCFFFSQNKQPWPMPCNLKVTRLDLPCNLKVTRLDLPCNLKVTRLDLPCNLKVTRLDLPCNLKVTRLDSSDEIIIVMHSKILILVEVRRHQLKKVMSQNTYVM